jgi:hypothetical protein
LAFQPLVLSEPNPALYAKREKVEASSLYDDLEKREFFIERTRKLALDPATTTTFDWLEIDDRVSHAQQAAESARGTW